MDIAIDTRNLTVKIKRYDPERDAAPRWEEFQVEADPMDRVLDVLQNDQVGPGRDARPAAIVRARRLRLGRDADQRRQRPGLQDPGQEPEGRHAHGRADPRPAGDQGPDRRHEAVLRPLQVGHAVPGQRRPAADDRAAPVAGRAGPVRRHDQVHPLRLLHDGLPAVLGRPASTSARRRSSTRIASSSTRATRAPPSGSKSSTTPRASGVAGPSSIAAACPRDIQVTQAIQEVKHAMLTGSLESERPSRTGKGGD